MKYTAKQVYNKLLNEDKILTLNGQIKFFLGDVSIIVKQKDVVGNIIQEWLQGWLDKNNIEYAPSENSQMPPDFFLNPDDKQIDLLEVKAYNSKANPGFDIADFKMYEREIIEKPFMLNVDYLIFAYDMSKDGIVTIKNVWLKKVWEITRPMENWPLNLQVKNGVVHKMRPGVWYGKTSIPLFNSMEDFLSAVEETVFKNKDTHDDFPNWRDRFISNYKKHYGVDIDIPRWAHIKANYAKVVKQKNK